MGSHDRCHLDSFLVRRMDLGFGCGFNDKIFRPYVRFCCMDVGKIIPVALRMLGTKAGNYNDRMVLVSSRQNSTCHLLSSWCDNRMFKPYWYCRFPKIAILARQAITIIALLPCMVYRAPSESVSRTVQDRKFCSARQYGKVWHLHTKDICAIQTLFDERYIIWHDTTITSCGAKQILPISGYFGYPIIQNKNLSFLSVSALKIMFSIYLSIQLVQLKFCTNGKSLLVPVDIWIRTTIYHTDRTHGRSLKYTINFHRKCWMIAEPLTICVKGWQLFWKGCARLRHIVDDCTPDSLLRVRFKLDLF